MPDTSPPLLFVVGRIVQWVILALMLVSVVYSLVISFVNWSSILV